MLPQDPLRLISTNCKGLALFGVRCLGTDFGQSADKSAHSKESFKFKLIWVNPPA
jgi:hypothetical protein